MSNNHIEVTDREIARQENVKHLELIQAIVTRLAQNSFLIKAWTLTIAAAAYGFSVNRFNWRIAAIGAAAILLFWVLDSYFLRQERLFRYLYNHARRGPTAIKRFSMNIAPYSDFATVKPWRVFRSITLSLFYGGLLLIGLLAILFTPSPQPSAEPGPAQTPPMQSQQPPPPAISSR